MNFESRRARINKLASSLVDYPFRSIENQTAVNPRVQEIPCQVIQTWEENSFGRRHLRSLREFRRKNQDLSFKLFDARSRLEYMLENWNSHPILEIFLRSRFGVLKADIFRYCIIYQLGGYYFDISKGIASSITSLHPDRSGAFISFEGNDNLEPLHLEKPLALLRPEKLVIQWGFGFRKEHEVLELLINNMVGNFENFADRSFANPKQAILEFSGPFAMTRAVREALELNPSMEITQLDVDFDGQGIYSLNGSGARHLRFPSYASLRNEQLFASKNSIKEV